MNECLFICFFFFSSRRRHTRLTCDWSSDVCSSDLLDRPDSPLRTGNVAVRAIERPPVGFRPPIAAGLAGGRWVKEIGRASCRERVEIWAGAGVVEKKKRRTNRECSTHECCSAVQQV